MVEGFKPYLTYTFVPDNHVLVILDFFSTVFQTTAKEYYSFFLAAVNENFQFNHSKFKSNKRQP